MNGQYWVFVYRFSWKLLLENVWEKHKYILFEFDCIFQEIFYIQNSMLIFVASHLANYLNILNIVFMMLRSLAGKQGSSRSTFVSSSLYVIEEVSKLCSIALFWLFIITVIFKFYILYRLKNDNWKIQLRKRHKERTS